MADKDLQVRFGVGHLSYQKKQRTRITYKSPTQINSPWIGVNCSSAEWYQNRGEGVLNLRRDVDTIGGGASTDYSPFYGNTSVTEVVLPNEITNIGDYAFNGCTNLDKVVITSEVPPTLGDNVFEDTTTVYVPYEYLDAYEEAWGDEVDIAPIGNYYQITVTAGEHGSATGSGWYALNESVTLTATADEGYEFTQWSDGNTDNPRTITVLGDATYTCAFQALKLIRYTSTNQASGTWVTNNTDTTRNTYDNTTHEGVLYLNNGVTSIGGSNSTDYSPFFLDTGLTAIDMSDSGLTNINVYAFGGCSSLTSNMVALPSELVSIEARGFQGCPKIYTLELPNTVRNIGVNAWSTSISNQFTSLTINAATPPSFGYGVSAVGGIVVAVPTESVELYKATTAFSYSPIVPISNSTNKRIVYKSNIEIADDWVNACTDTTRNTYDNTTHDGVLYLNSNVYGIGNAEQGNPPSTFSNNNILSVDLSDSGLVLIGNNTFQNSRNLTSAILPPDVVWIKYQAFASCTSLTSINIPSGVTNIGDYAFNGCSGLTSITVDSNNITYNDGNGSNCVIETSRNRLFVGCKNTVIPNGVVSIYNSAFYGCTGLTSITIPNSVTTIGRAAFNGCSGLTSINIPSGVTNIENSTFYNCTSLTSITITSGVTSIGDYAFFNCRLLSSLNIPDTVTSISQSAFWNCSGLTSATIGSGVTSIRNGAFNGCTALTSVTCEATTPPTLGTNNFTANNDTLYVPAASVSAYQSDSSWSAAFTTITAI